MAKRKSISKKLRFEVFKRDKFTCQYCGQKAPDVILVIDHIDPVSKGGTNHILNLITSCQGCNAGKSNILLSDNSMLEKQREQMEEIEERKQQIKMMLEWQKQCMESSDLMVNYLAQHWLKISGYSFNILGKNNLRKYLQKYPLEEIIKAMDIAIDRYGEIDNESSKYTHESSCNASSKIPSICYFREKERENPGSTKVFYLRGILRNRLHYVHDAYALTLLQQALKTMPYDDLEKITKEVRNWTEFKQIMEEMVEVDDGR